MDLSNSVEARMCQVSNIVPALGLVVLEFKNNGNRAKRIPTHLFLRGGPTCPMTRPAPAPYVIYATRDFIGYRMPSV